MSRGIARGLPEFLDSGLTAYHAAHRIIARLESRGFHRLEEGSRWQLEPGTSYYVERNGSSVIAFNLGAARGNHRFLLAGAHTDSPSLKWKFASLVDKKGYSTFATEVYGGPIISTWLDRDLAVSGRLFLADADNDQVTTRLVDSGKAVGILPNLAIHMNKEVNKGFEYNRQTHLQVLSGLEKNTGLLDYFAELEGFDPQTVLGADLFFRDISRASVIGEELLVSGRIDNLAMCHAALEALLEGDGKGQEATQVALFFDNEEIGSRTPQGADSSFLDTTLRRIILETGGDEVDYLRAKARSFLVSVDGAHGMHPNFPDKHDPDYAPVLNHGPVIKEGAIFKYATHGATAAPIVSLARDLDIPLQRLINRSDIPSGSTIGSMSAALSGIPTVDLGNPMLAMHSIREVAGVRDHETMIRLLTGFYRDQAPLRR